MVYSARLLSESLGQLGTRVRIPLSPPFLCAPIAQLDRASDYESEGCWFDSIWAHQTMLGNELRPAQPIF